MDRRFGEGLDPETNFLLFLDVQPYQIPTTFFFSSCFGKDPNIGQQSREIVNFAVVQISKIRSKILLFCINFMRKFDLRSVSREIVNFVVVQISKLRSKIPLFFL